MTSRPSTDSDLVVRARRGGTHAFAELVRPHQEVAFRTAYFITRNSADAEEATQEALFKAYRALGRFRDGAPFRPWLLAIVANEARNRIRSTARREALTARAAAEPQDAVAGPEAVTLARERRDALLAAVEQLPDSHRLVVACRYFLDLGEAETAAVLGIRRGTVKSRLARALDRLRETV
jgi:RNA polymerase sigma factor (sigma-70 family)